MVVCFKAYLMVDLRCLGGEFAEICLGGEFVEI